MTAKKTIIIAEIGPNHNGNLKKAYELVEAASFAGADYAKFQTSIPEYHISRFAKKAQYQKKNTGSKGNQLSMAKKITLEFSDYPKLYKFCKSKKIKFMSTPFDIPSIKFLKNFNKDFYKIPSGEINNLPYLREIAKTNRDIILSTGMSNMKEIGDALKVLTKKINKKRITILHCNTEYPSPLKDINLRAMITIRDKFKCKVGYSDHSEGLIVPITATSIGASIIEKHLTLNKKMRGPDHKASLEPDEFKKMVEGIRQVEKILGSKIKKVSRSEKKNIEIARKSIVASKKIIKGEILSATNMLVKRPGNGISPMKWDQIVGSRAKRNYNEDEQI